MTGIRRVSILILFVFLATVLVACGGGAATPAAPEATKAPDTGAPATTEQPAATQPEEVAPQPTEPAGPQIPEIVPIVEGAIDLKVTSDNTYISYQAPDTTVETVTAFYQEQLASLGWEQRSKKDSGFGDSITLLRTQEDYNISVTIQSIAGSTNVRILITLIPR